MAAIIVTGVAELDAALASLEPKLQKKGIRKATREAAKKVVMPVVKASIRAGAYDTGAMHDAVKVRATSRSIKKKTDIVKQFTRRDGKAGSFNVKKIVGQEFGAKVEITRKELNKQLVKRDIAPLKDSDYYYPAAVELGADGTEPKKPIRRVLKSAHAPTLAVFRDELRAALDSIAREARAKA